MCNQTELWNLNIGYSNVSRFKIGMLYHSHWCFYRAFYYFYQGSMLKLQSVILFNLEYVVTK